MGLFRKDIEESPFGGLSGDTTVSVQPGEDTESQDDFEDDYPEPGTEEYFARIKSDATKLRGMSLEDVEQQMAESIAEGDLWELGDPEAMELYTRAIALRGLIEARNHRQS
jgi:hypothetical protein